MNDLGAAAPMVLLELPGGDCIPIYIGLWEAISIRNAIKGEVLPRPITHDLFVEVLKRLHATVTALSIDSLEDMEILPVGQKPFDILSVKATLKWDVAQFLAFVGEVRYTLDKNKSKISEGDLRVFEDKNVTNQLGFALLAQAKW
jgi:hypothetical protein